MIRPTFAPNVMSSPRVNSKEVPKDIFLSILNARSLYKLLDNLIF
jgi:hypothetical protein